MLSYYYLFNRARKILNLRIFEDANQKRWAKSTSDLNLEILCVSQFTLYHKLKGNKPDFHYAMGPKESKILYEKVLTLLKTMYDPLLIKGKVNILINICMYFSINWLINFINHEYRWCFWSSYVCTIRKRRSSNYWNRIKHRSWELKGQ